MADYLIYTDGGARGNPGVAGAGAVIKNSKGVVIKEIAEPLGEQTNNYAEYSAVLLALQQLKKIIKKEDRGKVEVSVFMDSELIKHQLSGEWEIKEEKLFPFFIKIHNLQVSHFPNITFHHIPREENKEADALSNKAMDAGSQSRLL